MTEGGVPQSSVAQSARKKRETGDVVRLAVAAIIVVLLVAFVLENSASVRVHFIFLSAKVSLIWALLVPLVLGVGADRLFIWKRSQHVRTANRAVANRKRTRTR